MKDNTSQKAIWIQELIDMENLFCKTFASEGSKGWASFFEEEGAMVGKNGDPVRGNEAIQLAMSGSDTQVGFSLVWESMKADVSEDGKLGYTFGKYLRKWTEDGENKEETGKYMTVWKKNKAGQWKISVDIGN